MYIQDSRSEVDTCPRMSSALHLCISFSVPGVCILSEMNPIQMDPDGVTIGTDEDEMVQVGLCRCMSLTKLARVTLGHIAGLITSRSNLLHG